MKEFVHAHSFVTYLPCDARHYFHTKCIRTWLSGSHEGCPLCQVPVDYQKSIEVDQQAEYGDLLLENSRTADLLSIENSISLIKSQSSAAGVFNRGN